MTSRRLLSSPGAVRLSQDQIRKHIRNPDWFHLVTEDAQVTIRVHLFRLPAPDRSLVADWAGVRSSGQTSITFVFGQLPPGASRMTGALVVQMSRKALRQAFRPEFAEAVRRYAESEGIEPVVHTPLAAMYPEERIVTERAQILAVTAGEDEAEMRFYRVSRADMNAIQQEVDVDLVYPVVEVRMPAEELVHLMHTLDPMLRAGEQP
jgi:hypothetical protein